MKKEYIPVQIEVVHFENKNVITTSSPLNPDNLGPMN